LLVKWLEPLQELDAVGDPLPELQSYIRRKLEMARDFPRESRLFANEILQGAPRIKRLLESELKPLVDEKAEVLKGWMKAGKINPGRPTPPDFLDLVNHAALCRFRRPGSGHSRPGPRRRGPVRGCGPLSRDPVSRGAATE
jgi:hypothetical protein